MSYTPSNFVRKRSRNAIHTQYTLSHEVLGASMFTKYNNMVAISCRGRRDFELRVLARPAAT